MRKILKNNLIIITVVAIAVVLVGISGLRQQVNKNNMFSHIVAEAENLIEGYYYDEALKLIDDAGYSQEKTAEIREKIKAEKSKLREYDGQVYHVFFHSLIVYPELAFDGDYMQEGYDMWMTTVSEFKAMLPQIYERNFILVNLTDIKKGEKLLLPEGKKPLIISIDDVNYYDYMENDGFADRLVVGEKGNVATEVKNLNGEYEVTYDGDVMPILDKFVEEHPDFSYRGAKGIVAVTGYEGAFGYNFIKEQDEDRKSELKAKATEVAKAFKNTGWLIACHSYTHNDYFRDGGVSNEDLHYDTNRFKERIYEVVLSPDIYISPFGYHLSEGDERLMYLKNMGYNFFCPVSPAMRTFFTEEDVLISERFNLDRYNMRTKKDYINQVFFDVDSVYYTIK